MLKRIACAALASCGMGVAHAETMPQLDFGNRLLLAQVIWGAIIFAGFYFLVSRWGLPRVGAVLEMRAATIAGDLDRARASKAEADRAAAEQQAARRQATAQSQAALAQATQQAKEQAAARATAQEARLEAQISASETQIAQARASAMGAVRQVASETAALLVARLTSGHADAHRADEAVGQVLAERGLA